MDQQDLSTKLEYLEQQHQADQAKIAQLQQQIESQTYKFQEQKKHLHKLEESLEKTQDALASVPQVDQQLNALKNEIFQTIEQRYAKQEQPPNYSGQAVVNQLESHTKVLNELRRELDRVQRSDEKMLLARTEVERLNKTVTGFELRLQELFRQMTAQERGRSNGQQETQQHLQASKFELALEDVREEIRRHREHMDFQMAQRERLLKSWTDLAEKQEQRFKENETLMDKYVEHYQQNKRALASLQEFQEKVHREQHQADELQRLAENRQKTTIEKLQADYEQRWQRQGLEWQPRLEGLQKDVLQIKEQLSTINKFNQTVDEQITMVLQIIEEDIQSRATANQEWQDRFQALASGRA